MSASTANGNTNKIREQNTCHSPKITNNVLDNQDNLTHFQDIKSGTGTIRKSESQCTGIESRSEDLFLKTSHTESYSTISDTTELLYSLHSDQLDVNPTAAAAAVDSEEVSACYAELERLVPDPNPSTPYTRLQLLQRAIDYIFHLEQLASPSNPPPASTMKSAKRNLDSVF